MTEPKRDHRHALFKELLDAKYRQRVAETTKQRYKRAKEVQKLHKLIETELEDTDDAP